MLSSQAMHKVLVSHLLLLLVHVRRLVKPLSSWFASRKERRFENEKSTAITVYPTIPCRGKTALCLTYFHAENYP